MELCVLVPQVTNFLVHSVASQGHTHCGYGYPDKELSLLRYIVDRLWPKSYGKSNEYHKDNGLVLFCDLQGPRPRCSPVYNCEICLILDNQCAVFIGRACSHDKVALRSKSCHR